MWKRDRPIGCGSAPPSAPLPWCTVPAAAGGTAGGRPPCPAAVRFCGRGHRCGAFPCGGLRGAQSIVCAARRMNRRSGSRRDFHVRAVPGYAVLRRRTVSHDSGHVLARIASQAKMGRRIGVSHPPFCTQAAGSVVATSAVVAPPPVAWLPFDPADLLLVATGLHTPNPRVCRTVCLSPTAVTTIGRHRDRRRDAPTSGRLQVLPTPPPSSPTRKCRANLCGSARLPLRLLVPLRVDLLQAVAGMRIQRGSPPWSWPFAKASRARRRHDPPQTVARIHHERRSCTSGTLRRS